MASAVAVVDGEEDAVLLSVAAEPGLRVVHLDKAG